MYGKVCKYQGSEHFQTLAFPVFPKGQKAAPDSSIVTKEEEINRRFAAGAQTRPPPGSQALSGQ